MLGAAAAAAAAAATSSPSSDYTRSLADDLTRRLLVRVGVVECPDRHFVWQMTTEFFQRRLPLLGLDPEEAIVVIRMVLEAASNVHPHLFTLEVKDGITKHFLLAPSSLPTATSAVCGPASSWSVPNPSSAQTSAIYPPFFPSGQAYYYPTPASQMQLQQHHHQQQLQQQHFFGSTTSIGNGGWWGPMPAAGAGNLSSAPPMPAPTSRRIRKKPAPTTPPQPTSNAPCRKRPRIRWVLVKSPIRLDTMRGRLPLSLALSVYLQTSSSGNDDNDESTHHLHHHAQVVCPSSCDLAALRAIGRDNCFVCSCGGAPVGVMDAPRFQLKLSRLIIMDDGADEEGGVVPDEAATSVDRIQYQLFWNQVSHASMPEDSTTTRVAAAGHPLLSIRHHKPSGGERQTGSLKALPKYYLLQELVSNPALNVTQMVTNVLERLRSEGKVPDPNDDTNDDHRAAAHDVLIKKMKQYLKDERKLVVPPTPRPPRRQPRASSILPTGGCQILITKSDGRQSLPALPKLYLQQEWEKHSALGPTGVIRNTLERLQAERLLVSTDDPARAKVVATKLKACLKHRRKVERRSTAALQGGIV